MPEYYPYHQLNYQQPSEITYTQRHDPYTRCLVIRGSLGDLTAEDVISGWQLHNAGPEYEEEMIQRSRERIACCLHNELNRQTSSSNYSSDYIVNWEEVINSHLDYEERQRLKANIPPWWRVTYEINADMHQPPVMEAKKLEAKLECKRLLREFCERDMQEDCE